VSGAPGTTVTVDGTITNTGSTTIFLNNEDFTLDSSPFLLNGDVTDFFLNAPLFLAGDSNSGLIALFTFEVAGGTPGGMYTGSFLDVLGGPGFFDQNMLASTAFTVTVTSGTSVPEPSTVPLAAVGFLALAALVLVKKITPQQWTPRQEL
jgi:hypothetical protein